MLAPGQAFPSEGGVPSGDIDPTSDTAARKSSTMVMKSSTPTSSMSSMRSMSTGYSHKLSSGAIAGIVVAVVIVVALVAALLFLLGRHKTLLQFIVEISGSSPGHNTHPVTKT